MKLHENTVLFRQAVIAASEMMNIPEIYIEKDYWVTLALKSIFNSEAGEYAVFKGGTALSKCYKLLERFSEDIDLVAIYTSDETENQKKNKIKAMSKTVERLLPEIEIEGVTSKKGMLRKTCHEYTKIFKGQYGQVSDFIVLESSWLGNFEPYSEMLVSSYIYDMMLQRGQSVIIQDYGMNPFNVKVLSLERTFCEKIMSLVRFSYDDNPAESLKLKIRHTYDLTVLLENQGLYAFFESVEFDTMLRKVGLDDLDGYRNNNEWLLNHPAQALIFAELDTVWQKLKNTYNGDFRALIYGKLPPEQQVYNALKSIKDRLEQLDWNLKNHS